MACAWMDRVQLAFNSAHVRRETRIEKLVGHSSGRNKVEPSNDLSMLSPRTFVTCVDAADKIFQFVRESNRKIFIENSTSLVEGLVSICEIFMEIDFCIIIRKAINASLNKRNPSNWRHKRTMSHWIFFSFLQPLVCFSRKRVPVNWNSDRTTAMCHRAGLRSFNWKGITFSRLKRVRHAYCGMKFHYRLIDSLNR